MNFGPKDTVIIRDFLKENPHQVGEFVQCISTSTTYPIAYNITYDPEYPKIEGSIYSFGARIKPKHDIKHTCNIWISIIEYDEDSIHYEVELEIGKTRVKKEYFEDSDLKKILDSITDMIAKRKIRLCESNAVDFITSNK